jgi:tetratricopeptide (TPR) repeat protein
MSRREVTLVLGMGVLVLLVYLPSFPGEFHFDDFALMLENPLVGAPHFSYKLFLEEYGGRPLTLWTFHWNYRLFGTDPRSYHAFSLILHVIAAGLLLIWLKRRGLDQKAAVLAASVFALHPLQTQAVNYIWSRSVLLMFCFGMASLLFAEMARQSGRFRPLARAMSLICFQLAIWSRADGLIFLVPLVLADGVPQRVSEALTALYRHRVPVLIALMNVGAFALFMSRAKPRDIGWTHPHVLSYWWSQTVAFWKYVAVMFWPAGLSVDHDFVVAGRWPPLLALLGLVVLALTLGRLHARYPVVVYGALWMALAMAPAALLPNSDPFNESRAYPALAGFSVVLAGVFQKASSRLPRLAHGGVVGLLLLAMVPGTAARNHVWRSDLALWQDAAEKNPAKARVQYNLGAAWARAGEIDRAEQSFTTALGLEPGDDLTQAALGYCAESRCDWSLALQRYQRAVSLNSRNSYADEGLRRVLKHMEATLR